MTRLIDTYTIDNMRLYRREDTGIYYVELGRGKKKSLKTKNLTKANHLFAAMKEEILREKLLGLPTVKNDITLKVFKEDYKKWSEEMKKAPDSIRSDELSLRTFIDRIGNKKLAAITVKDLDDFNAKILKAKRSVETLNTYIRRLRAAFNKAVEWGYLERNPYDKKGRGKVLIKGVKKLPRFLEPDEFPKMFDAIKDPDFRAMVLLYIITGCRRAELVALKWPEVKQNYIVILATKNKEQRVVMISEAIQELLSGLKRTKKGYVFPKWRSKDTVTRKFHKCIIGAGMKPIRLHDLRHTAASYLAMEGVSLDTIGVILGQKDKKVTEIYRHLLPGHMQEQMEKLGNAVEEHFHTAPKMHPRGNLTLVTIDDNKDN